MKKLLKLLLFEMFFVINEMHCLFEISEDLSIDQGSDHEEEQACGEFEFGNGVDVIERGSR